VDQAEYDVRLEYGLQGLRALTAESLSMVVVVDVLSFSTCVSVAVERDAIVFPYPWTDEGLTEYGVDRQAVVAGRRGDDSAKFSLSPGSLMHAVRGDRVVLPHPMARRSLTKPQDLALWWRGAFEMRVP
jgi:2-phosphosulfolactate phosphatase